MAERTGDSEQYSAIPQWIKYGFVFVASLGLSIGGIVYGAFHNPADGGRGGALAVAIAFFSLFIRRDFGLLAYRAVAEQFPRMQEEIQKILDDLAEVQTAPNAEASAIEQLKNRVNGIFEQIQVNANGQTRQNFAVAAASIVGTLAWGFGDIAAQYLKCHLQR